MAKSCGGRRQVVSGNLGGDKHRTHAIDEDTDECGVETVLRRERGNLSKCTIEVRISAKNSGIAKAYLRVGHGLGDEDNTDGETSDDVTV